MSDSSRIKDKIQVCPKQIGWIFSLEFVHEREMTWYPLGRNKSYYLTSALIINILPETAIASHYQIHFPPLSSIRDCHIFLIYSHLFL